LSQDLLEFARMANRGTDSNSLLRQYDLVKAILDRSPLDQTRARADKILRRIARELQKRKVRL
jgi:hypothetical protein